MTCTAGGGWDKQYPFVHGRFAFLPSPKAAFPASKIGRKAKYFSKVAWERAKNARLAFPPLPSPC